MKRATLLALALIVAVTPLVVPHHAHGEEIEFGSVRVTNDYGGQVTVRLYHADALDRVFATWSFGPSKTANLAINGEAFTIGGDWLIDVSFRNGVKSQRRLVYKVGTHRGGTWTIKASDIYRGKR